MRSAAFSIAVATILICVAPAHAEDFTYSFSGDSQYPGTVTGVVDGLENGQTVSPTSVTATYDGITYKYGNNASGSFTVMNDQIISGGYQGYDNSMSAILYLESQPELQTYNGQNVTTVYNSGGFDEIKFTQVSSAPEPAAWALMIVGLAGLGMALRKAKSDTRRRISALVAA